MLDINSIKDELVNSLLPLNPDKIILFGSYANGTANEESDLDIFLVKDNIEDMTNYEVEAKIKLIDFMRKNRTNGIDILSSSSKDLENTQEFFYKEILEQGRLLYERNSSS